jgi:hypothetical protein
VDLAELRRTAIRSSDYAVLLLRNTEISRELRRRGWDENFAEFMAQSLAECSERLTTSWTPPPGFAGKWVRLLMDRIDGGPDPLSDATSEAAEAVEMLSRSASSDDTREA